MSKVIDQNPVSSPELVEQVKLQRLTRSTIILFGQSGVGKTTIMTGAAKGSFDQVLLSNFAGKGPVEATGLGLPEWRYKVTKPDGGVDMVGSAGDKKILEMIFSQPEGIPTVDRVGESLVYWVLDEWGNWDPQVRAAFHGVLSPPDGGHRYLGSHIIGPNVVCAIATNRRCDGAAVGRYSIPECRRGSLMTLVPDPGNWWRWADSNPEYAATFVPTFIAYGNSVGATPDHKNHFLGDPEAFDPLVPNAQPSPRAWEEVMKVLAHKRAGHCSEQTARSNIQGWVGDKASNALHAFLSVITDRPAFEAMKQDPTGFKVPDRVDQQFMLASGAMLYATQGVADLGTALHRGTFDWVFDGMSRLTPEVAAYGLTTADRRGIKVSERRPDLWADLVGR